MRPMTKPPNRRERRAAESQARQAERDARTTERDARAAGEMTDRRFTEIADRFIDLANRENTHVEATDLHMAFLWAAARYNAHVGKNVVGVDEHEPFVDAMVKAYAEMLRQHLADPEL